MIFSSRDSRVNINNVGVKDRPDISYLPEYVSFISYVMEI